MINMYIPIFCKQRLNLTHYRVYLAIIEIFPCKESDGSRIRTCNEIKTCCNRECSSNLLHKRVFQIPAQNKYAEGYQKNPG